MAGEWLKFDANTPDKPEVFAITAKMGWDDPDLTVGKLLRVWRWFDQHTIDGNAPNVTLALLDRVAGVSGFASAMCEAGWLAQTDSGLKLPNFERHNGKTAKDRVLTAKRVASHKARNEGTNAQGNGASVSPGVSGALPRAEQSRAETKKESKSHSRKRGKSPESDPRSKHPAIQAFREAASMYPKKDLYDEIILKIGEEPDVGRMKFCYVEWIKKDWKPTNLGWLFDWYLNGGPPEQNHARHNSNSGSNDTASANRLAAESYRGAGVKIIGEPSGPKL